jgi:uncharacterized repeat protein (TIGR03803 family)
VFKVDTTGNETILISLGGEGGSPHGSVVFDAQGNLYGTALKGGLGRGDGTVFKVDTTDRGTTLYKFAGSPDGANPQAGLVLDAQGNLYGTTFRGGTVSPGNGTVFKVDAAGNETVLYRFTGKSGSSPYGNLVLDGQGNLYGTTARGGDHSSGTVFKVDMTGNETVLYSFTGKNGDGAIPYGGLVLDAQGNLYGTTSRGGAQGYGTVFKLTH